MEQNMMVHHSSGKNYKPKGFNGKKAFQVTLLLAVCIWLMYQIKQYSHGKHKSYGGNTQNKLHEQHGTILLGRKGNVGSIVGSSIVFDDENVLEEDERRDNVFDRNIEEKEDEVKQKRQHTEVLSNGKEAEESYSNELEGREKESMKTKEDNAKTQVREEDEKVSFDEEEDEDSKMGEKKIVLQISEAESTNNPGQGEMGYGVHGFHDENGIPSGGLDHVNSTPS